MKRPLYTITYTDEKEDEPSVPDARWEIFLTDCDVKVYHIACPNADWLGNTEMRADTPNTHCPSCNYKLPKTVETMIHLLRL